MTRGGEHDHGAPLARGALLALLAALSFGATTPIIARFGHRAGPFAIASLLYFGAALGATRLPFGAASRARARGAASRSSPPLPRGRLLLVASCGAFAAPVCLTWGLQRTGGASASLLLNFEALFTALLAWRVHREPLGGRVVAALLLMLFGGACLVASAPAGGTVGIGAAAVIAATSFWALDNTLSRPLSDFAPTRVVRWKALLGAVLSLAVSRAIGEAWPTAREAAVLASCGVTGYGLSLRWYLLAQRELGAARTASVFATAPFVGALVAWAMGEGSISGLTATAALFFAAGAALHLTERHGHEHAHEATDHEHAHRHDDGHHDHRHEPPVVGEHVHRHSHEPQIHAHPHALDVHHRHRH